jgi:predicted transposase/invertase (TIGR01784 family)
LLNPFQLPRIRGEKATIIDIRAKDQKGVSFIVEMQVAEKDGFDKRVLYYTSKDYASQILIGDQYPKLQPVYFIGILDFEYFPGNHYLSTHLILDEHSGKCVFKDMKFRFIELPKFKKEADELIDIVDKWAFFLKNAKSLEVIPSSTDDEGLREAYDSAERYNWTKEEFDAYIDAGVRAQDYIGEKALAVRRAVEKVRSEQLHSIIHGLFGNGVPKVIEESQ